MSSFSNPWAAQAEDMYRRERAAREFRLSGGVHTSGPTRRRLWRGRRGARRTEA